MTPMVNVVQHEILNHVSDEHVGEDSERNLGVGVISGEITINY